jgi:hypothetical protein
VHGRCQIVSMRFNWKCHYILGEWQYPTCFRDIAAQAKGNEEILSKLALTNHLNAPNNEPEQINEL